MKIKLIYGCILCLIIAGCTALPEPQQVLETASVRYGIRQSVSIPKLSMNVDVKRGEEERSLFFTGQVIAARPDKLRMKLTKANYHLVSMVIDGHHASLHFPRTAKVFDTELNKPLLEEKNAIDIVPTAIEMALILIRGPFPMYPLHSYSVENTAPGLFTYTTAIQGGSLAIGLDPRNGEVRTRVYTFTGKDNEQWVVAFAFSKYESSGKGAFPRKIIMEISGSAKPDDLVRLEMFLSRISFDRPVKDKAFLPNWPADAVRIDEIPKNMEELFGKLEDDEKPEE